MWFVDRKRSQKDKDDKHRDGEQAQLQQQKEAEKAAADAASKEPEAFVVPGDSALLQYIGQCLDNVRPLPGAPQQASALARSFSATQISRQHLLSFMIYYSLLCYSLLCYVWLSAVHATNASLLLIYYEITS